MRKADNYFSIIPEWLTFNAELSDQAYRLYGALARWANSDTKEAWPSVPTIAKRIGRSDRTVQRAMKELLELEMITLVRTPDEERSTNTYVLRTQNPKGVAELSPSGGKADGEGGGKSVTQSIPSRTRELSHTHTRAEMFEAMVEAWFGRTYEDMSKKLTTSHRQRVNRAIKELTEIGATPDEIRNVGRGYRAKWPELEVTPQALVNNWHSFTAEAQDAACKHHWQMIDDPTDENEYTYECAHCHSTTRVAARSI